MTSTAVLALALGVLVAACSSGGSAANHSSAPRASARSSSAATPGPDGVQSSWVVAENARPGTAQWQITGDSGPEISGYADTTAVTNGSVVHVFTSTATPSFHIEAYRMGFYQGLGARLIWRSPREAGTAQPVCPLTPGINMIQCHWTAPVTVPITAAWVQGDYLLKLVADGGRQSYVPLTIWDPSSHATYVVDNSVLTWQAWNTYGGYDMYGGAPPGQTPQYDTRARVMSFDRPYGYGQGAGDFVGNELPLVRFVEQHGLDVTYWTDISFTQNPNLLLDHRVYLSLGHAECWSNPQRDAAVTAAAKGVNFVFFGASPILRHVRLQSGPGDTGREMVDYRDPQADPIIRTDPAEATGNTWAVPPASLPPSLIVGDTYGGYDIDAPMVISDAGAWPFAGTGVSNGSSLPHVVRFDYDFYDPTQPGPQDVQILAHSPVPTGQRMSPTADMTYYTDPTSRSGVIATGTNNWIGSMSPCPGAQPAAACPAPALQQITGNVLRLFGGGPAGRSQPSVTNWHQFY